MHDAAPMRMPTAARGGDRFPVGPTRHGSRVSAWIIRSVMVLTIAIALWDLYLLASSSHPWS